MKFIYMIYEGLYETMSNLMPIISSILQIHSCYQLIFGTLEIINLTPMLSLPITCITIISKPISNLCKSYKNIFNFSWSIIWVVSIQNKFLKIRLIINSEIRWVVTPLDDVAYCTSVSLSLWLTFHFMYLSLGVHKMKWMKC